MGFFSIFWNVKTAFVGLPMIKQLPTTFFAYPLFVGVPLYTSFVLSSNFQYYDEYHSHLEEKQVSIAKA